jgi:hypothetical protein
VIDAGGSFSFNKSYYNGFLKSKLPEDLLITFEDEDSFWVPVKGKDEKSGEIKV